MLLHWQLKPSIYHLLGRIHVEIMHFSEVISTCWYQKYCHVRSSAEDSVEPDLDTWKLWKDKHTLIKDVQIVIICNSYIRQRKRHSKHSLCFLPWSVFMCSASLPSLWMNSLFSSRSKTSPWVLNPISSFLLESILSSLTLSLSHLSLVNNSYQKQDLFSPAFV